MPKKTILILGAGFGGLRAAICLGKKMKHSGLKDKYEIILVDKNDYHTYTPTLYEVATTSKLTADYLKLKRIVTFPVADSINGLPVIFKKGAIKNLNLKKKLVVLDGNQIITYEYLVIALGLEANDFGIPGVKNALQLKSFLHALEIRDKIFELLEEQDQTAVKDGASPKQLHIVVGGGGSTGVELAGELAEWICDPIYKKNCDIIVSIVEGSETILNNFDKRIIRAATNRLKRLGVKLITGDSILSVKECEAVLKSGRTIPHDAFIGTGGVKAPEIFNKFPLQLEHQGKIKVEDEMSCVLSLNHLHPLNAAYGKIYGVGDIVCFYDTKTQKPVAGVARAAIIQGTIVANNIFEDIRLSEGLVNTAKHKKYCPQQYPYVIPVGGKWAVAKIGPFIIKGFLGWILKGLIELNYLISIMPIRKALSIWFTGLRIFIKNDRLG